MTNTTNQTTKPVYADVSAIANSIIAKATSLGFSACGIVPLADLAKYQDQLNKRIADFPEALPAYEKLKRLDVTANAPWAKSVVVCAWDYGQYQIPENLDRHIARLYLFDWHKRPESDGYKAVVNFSDFLRGHGMRTENDEIIGIAPARLAAAMAGIALIRRNNFAYTENGSWVWLETWLIDYEFPKTATKSISGNLDPCPEDCQACVKACPTKALCGPQSMNLIKCATWLMYSARDQQNAALRPLLGQRIYGCDSCQSVCPMNQRITNNSSKAFPIIDNFSSQLTLEQLAFLSPEKFEAELRPHFRFIPPDQSWVLRSNALRAMGNSGQKHFQPILQKASRDPDPRIAEMASWALNRLNETNLGNSNGN